MADQARVRVGDNLYRKGAVYYAAAVPPGKRHLRFKSLGVTTKARAKELLPAAVAEIRGGRSAAGEQLGSNATVGALLDAYLQHKQRTVSERTYRDSYLPAAQLHLKPWFAENCPVAARVTPEVLIDWHTDQIDAEAATWTIKARWTVLTGALTFGVRRQVLAANPADALERGERPAAGDAAKRFLTDPEMRQLVDAAHTPRWRLLILVLLFAGLRLSEALGLRWQDIDFDEGVIHVREQLRRRADKDGGWLKELKTGAGRRDVVMMDALAFALRRYQPADAHPAHPVIATITGQHVTQRNATREFARAVSYSGLHGVTPHALRHTFASMLVHQTKGADVAFVADQLGHADPSITLRVYAKLFRAARSRDDARRMLDAEFGTIVSAEVHGA